MRINYLAFIVTAITTFVMSSLYYSPLLLGKVWRAVDQAAVAGKAPSKWKALGEIARTLVIAYVFAPLVSLLGVSGDWKAVIILAIWLWLGFSAMMWVGAIMWEHTPWLVAAIHSGDWLLKTILMAVILGLWRG